MVQNTVKSGRVDTQGAEACEGHEAGDQLLTWDGQSLIGITQERAALLMMTDHCVAGVTTVDTFCLPEDIILSCSGDNSSRRVRTWPYHRHWLT